MGKRTFGRGEVGRSRRITRQKRSTGTAAAGGRDSFRDNDSMTWPLGWTR